MPKIYINNIKHEIEEGLTLIQACEQAGTEIPRFCYHEKLAIAGNCRMCLVEVENAPKLAASCATTVMEGMKIHTESKKVTKAREAVMELLLVNHPLDCPVCDQGGECDLQDQAYKYGSGANKFIENKRAVANKDFGPLISTNMTRCIHCTRCVRFLEDIAGLSEIGIIGRGENAEITSYVQGSLKSELSGNIIDLCPVGALTSKPYEFKARNWELNKTHSIDIIDPICPSIRIDSRSSEVMRILPRSNEDINEEWISDITRFSYDGLKNSRIDRPYIRKNGKLHEATMQDAINLISKKIKSIDPSEIAFLTGKLVDLETIITLKLLAEKLKVNNLGYDEPLHKINSSKRGNFLFNTGIKNIEKSDYCLIVGADLKKSAPLIGARIRKAQLNYGLKVDSISGNKNQIYENEYLGNSLNILEKIYEGEDQSSLNLKKAKNPILIIGEEILKRNDSENIISLCHDIALKYNLIKDNFNGFNVLINHSGYINSLIANSGIINSNKTSNIIQKVKDNNIKLIYMLGCDNEKLHNLGNCFKIYQGHHGDILASKADIVLPSPAFTEKEGIYFNIEGRAQYAYKAINPPGEAIEDWLIILKLAKNLDIDLLCDGSNDNKNAKNLNSANHNNSINIFSVFNLIREKIYKEIINKDEIDKINHNNKIDLSKIRLNDNHREVINYDTPITESDDNHYMNNPISKASLTMSKIVKSLEQKT